jgi:asparagine synthase (glutamine-hydrolysing)
MCGITGYCSFRKTFNSEVINSMTASMAHRGPDADGTHLHNDELYQIGFGHKRLSILDLSQGGKQPMHFENLSITYNGEVYNFTEVREELITEGYTFQSTSDTEVLIKGFHKWGKGLLNHLIGMFAFVIHDKEAQKMYLFRDRAGVKPLYYQWYNEILIFGSELKSFHPFPLFHKEIDVNSLALFLQYSYIPAPHSIFKHTFKVRPGHYLELDLKSKTLDEKKYWDVFDYYNKGTIAISEEDAINETERLLKSAYEYRMVADVPVGVFLSGGYDSTSVAALLQTNRSEKLKTFTIGFKENEYNEAPEAEKIANYLGTEHTSYYVTPKEAAEVIPTLADIYDEPFADNSTVPTTLVSQLARKDVTVALSADGGDEIFGGYHKFGQSIKYASMAPSWALQAVSKSMNLINPDHIPYFRSKYNFSTRYEKMKNIWSSDSSINAMKIIAQYLTEKEARLLVNRNFNNYHTYFDDEALLNPETEALNKLLAIDYKTFLVDNNLVKVDRATMSVSLEGREPMLDHRIIEFVSQLPADLKINNGTTKYILKEIVHKYVPKVLMERPKMPFIAPLTIWFKTELKEMMMDHLNEDSLNRHGLLNAKEVINLRDRYFNGQALSHQKLWNLLVFQMWYARWMESEKK